MSDNTLANWDAVLILLLAFMVDATWIYSLLGQSGLSETKMKFVLGKGKSARVILAAVILLIGTLNMARK